jgi:dimethylhistidine N-methyltransferase
MNPTAGHDAQFAAEVREALSGRPRRLPTKRLYDALGSRLFEAICELPWYPITRAERRLLERFAPAVAERVAPPAVLVELGSGSGHKTAIVARALAARGAPVTAHVVDLSPTALELSRRALGALPGVSVVAHEALYEPGLGRALAGRPPAGAALVLLLGSNLGNFEPDEAVALLARIGRALRPGDRLLVGGDLVKAEADVLLAYDDPLGVTAAFDKNLLLRVNRELGADFDLGAFAHRAIWNGAAARVEMHLVSRRAQRVRIPGAGLELALAEGESIWTESSYKYTPEGLSELGRAAGVERLESFVDVRDRFCATLFGVPPASLR